MRVGHKTERVLVIACGALAREMLDIQARNHLDHIDIQCLPAKLHLYPEKIPDAVEEAVLSYRDSYERILIAYADCGTGGLLQARCAALGVEMIEGPHCYSFYEGNAQFAENEDDLGTFYLTDFLVRQFDAFIWRPMGLDRHPELLADLFGHYKTVVYQAQVKDAALEREAAKIADRLGLKYRYRFTGYGDLERFTLSEGAAGRA